MGGILIKLAQNGNEITVAYMTSGNIAVFDHDVRRYARLPPPARVERHLDGRRPLADLDGGWRSSWPRSSRARWTSRRCRRSSACIREAEAVAGIRRCRDDARAARFLNLPFYQTGKVRKDPIGPDDVRIVADCCEEIEPHLVFVAGDLSDPHGTHRMCKEAIDRRCAAHVYSGGRRPEVWLYRGAWQEWPVTDADMAGAACRRKSCGSRSRRSSSTNPRRTRAPFPGPDEREFWQRVEERNKGTAAELDRLGLAEYFAMEAYVVEG